MKFIFSIFFPFPYADFGSLDMLSEGKQSEAVFLIVQQQDALAFLRGMSPRNRVFL